MTNFGNPNLAQTGFIVTRMMYERVKRHSAVKMVILHVILLKDGACARKRPCVLSH
jgi:hypothetical protein